MRRASSTRVRLALLAILLLAFALRVANLGVQELRGDESFGYFFMQQGYREIIDATIDLAEPHPVASYFVQKAWLGVSGTSEYALRFVGVCFSVLAVALFVRLARRLSLRTPAILAAALLFAASPYAVWHAQDARMYSISMALGIAVTWLAVEALARRRWQWIAAYIVTALLALHTHYYVAYLLVALTVFIVGRALVAPSARRAIWDWGLWNILLLILYTPWLAQASGILSDYGGNGDSPALANALERALAVFAVGETTLVEQRLWWATLAAGLLLLGALRLWLGGGSDRRTLWLLLCAIFVPLLLTWYSAQDRPIFNERYLIVAAPYFYLLAGAALQPVPRKRWLDLVAGAALGALIVGMLLSLYRYNFDPVWSKSRGWRELAARSQQLAGGVTTGQVRFAQNYPDPTLWYYLSVEPHLTLPPAALDATGAAREVAALLEQGIERVIMVGQSSPAWDGGGVADTALEDGYDAIATIPQDNFIVSVYQRTLAGATNTETLFGDGVTLRAAHIPSNQLTPNGVLPIYLQWETAPAITSEIKSTLQLLAPDGTVAAQVDTPLPTPSAQEAPTAYGILLPEELPPGDYRLILAVYDPTQPTSPRLLTQSGADHIDLATWQIDRPPP